MTDDHDELIAAAARHFVKVEKLTHTGQLRPFGRKYHQALKALKEACEAENDQ